MSTPKLFDVHTHVQFVAFKDDADLVIQRALDAGVWMVNVGTQKNTSEDAIKTTERYAEGVYATVGLHPIHTEKSYHDPQELGITSLHSQVYKDVAGGFVSRFVSREEEEEEFDYGYYKELAAHPKVVAVGECGLDYYRLGLETREKQKTAFIQQIELAHEVKKPLMIHCRSGGTERTSPQNGAGRNAFADLISILRTTSHKLPSPPGIIHFFSGTKNDAKELLGLGFSFSFGGVVTFTRDYDEVIKYISLERILLETDAPYVAPLPYRGKRNESAYILEIAKKIAEIKNVTFDEAALQTTKNAQLLFGV